MEHVGQMDDVWYTSTSLIGALLGAALDAAEGTLARALTSKNDTSSAGQGFAVATSFCD